MLDQLPAHILQHITLQLDYRDLLSFSLVCHATQAEAQGEQHWRRQCEKYWLKEEVEGTWRGAFREMYLSFGRYIALYARVSTLWSRLHETLGRQSHLIESSFVRPLSEEDLDWVETQLGYALPDDVRCSYRLCGGQRTCAGAESGLFGTYEVYGAHSDFLMPILRRGVHGAAPTVLDHEGFPGCLPLITSAQHSCIFLCLQRNERHCIQPGDVSADIHPHDWQRLFDEEFDHINALLNTNEKNMVTMENMIGQLHHRNDLLIDVQECLFWATARYAHNPYELGDRVEIDRKSICGNCQECQEACQDCKRDCDEDEICEHDCEEQICKDCEDCRDCSDPELMQILLIGFCRHELESVGFPALQRIEEFLESSEEEKLLRSNGKGKKGSSKTSTSAPRTTGTPKAKKTSRAPPTTKVATPVTYKPKTNTIKPKKCADDSKYCTYTYKKKAEGSLVAARCADEGTKCTKNLDMIKLPDGDIMECCTGFLCNTQLVTVKKDGTAVVPAKNPDNSSAPAHLTPSILGLLLLTLLVWTA